MGPGIGIEPLTLTAELSKPCHRHIESDEGIPGGLTDDAVHSQIKDFLELFYRIFGADPEDSINVGNFRDGRVTLGYAVQHYPYRHNTRP